MTGMTFTTGKDGLAPIVALIIVAVLLAGGGAAYLAVSPKEPMREPESPAPVERREKGMSLEVKEQAENAPPMREATVPAAPAETPKPLALSPLPPAPVPQKVSPHVQRIAVPPPLPSATLATTSANVKLGELEREIVIVAGDARPIGPEHYARLKAGLDAEAAGGADANTVAKLRTMLQTVNPDAIPLLLSSPPSSSPSTEQDPPVAQKSCENNLAPVFTNHITDMSKVNYIVPPPTMGAGPSLKPHSYIGTDHARVPVYAPIASTLKSGSYYVGGPYMLELSASCEVTVRFGHITEPVDAIKKLLPSEPKQDSRTEELAPVSFAAGELLGYTTGTDLAGNWDFGVYNSVTHNRYADDPAWNNSATYTTAVCPFDYFAADLKAVYVAKFNSTALGGNPPHGESFCR
ncbi:MAG: hypothetical protein HYW65_04655 [Candidatus Liptonbacteria bacterium]|nr:hypothetical protein [Candidatus Liptonbacteria bacterium]